MMGACCSTEQRSITTLKPPPTGINLCPHPYLPPPPAASVGVAENEKGISAGVVVVVSKGIPVSAGVVAIDLSAKATPQTTSEDTKPFDIDDYEDSTTHHVQSVTGHEVMMSDMATLETVLQKQILWIPKLPTSIVSFCSSSSLLEEKGLALACCATIDETVTDIGFSKMGGVGVAELEGRSFSNVILTALCDAKRSSLGLVWISAKLEPTAWKRALAAIDPHIVPSTVIIVPEVKKVFADYLFRAKRKGSRFEWIGQDSLNQIGLRCTFTKSAM
jgi:hypothetical protein